MFLWLARILLFIPFWIFHPTFIKGRKNLPKGKAILCSNHYSNLDIVLYYINTSEKLNILAKKELFKNKLFGALLKYLGGIAIDRESNDLNAIKSCIKVLKNDKKLVIFPEGTRLKDNQQILGEFKSGLAMIALKTKTPIIPIWIERKPKVFRKSVYHIGKPFELTQFYGMKLDEALLNEANQIVRNKMLELAETVNIKKMRNKV